MGILDIIKKMLGKDKPTYMKRKYTCPNCGYKKITLDLERCPKCGVHIKSMFKKKCPKCNTLNEIDAEVCQKCGYLFKEVEKKERETAYRCPVCGYTSKGYFTTCPSCGAELI